MKGLMQRALGDAWDRLPPSLQAHHLPGTTVDFGAMDVSFPAFMQPVLFLLSRLGALVHRRGLAVQTTVEKSDHGDRQLWHRTLRYADGQTLRFNSAWTLSADGHVVEFVNPWLALEMQPFVVGDRLHYRGLQFIVRLGRKALHIPEWLGLGHTTIEEWALDEDHFAMDFRMTHPLFGQVFRYAGKFKANVGTASFEVGPTPRPDPSGTLTPPAPPSAAASG
jgi:hypothetical protein